MRTWTCRCRWGRGVLPTHRWRMSNPCRRSRASSRALCSPRNSSALAMALITSAFSAPRFGRTRKRQPVRTDYGKRHPRRLATPACMITPGPPQGRVVAGEHTEPRAIAGNRTKARRAFARECLAAGGRKRLRVRGPSGVASTIAPMLRPCGRRPPQQRRHGGARPAPEGAPAVPPNAAMRGACDAWRP